MPAAPTSENGVPRTELQELQVKSQQVTDEVINSHNVHNSAYVSNVN